MEQEIEEIVEELNTDFSSSSLSRLLDYIGEKQTGVPDVMDFNHFVFLKCDTDEIYGAQERSFIEQISKIYVFPETKKVLSKESVPCRIIAVDLLDEWLDIYSAVLFMKIVIKAYEGWVLFVVRLSDGVHIGMKTFERDSKRNCILGEVDVTADVFSSMMWIDEKDDFMSYYLFLYEKIMPKDDSIKDFDEIALRRRGIQYDYIEDLELIGRQMKLDMTYAIQCYKEWFNEESSYSFFKELQDVLESLEDIKSSRVNTLELLFEAEELERISLENEKKYSYNKDKYLSEDIKELDMIDMEGKDPEEIIKMIKGKKRII